MPGSIMPLPVMLEEEDQQVYDALEAPSSIVVRYGYQKLIAELPYDGSAKPGCGSQMVIRTDRGTELAEMLTTTCPNAGCGKSVSRKEMLGYIKNSGGKQYPFTRSGKILRVATADDLHEQARLDQNKTELIRSCKGHIAKLNLDMRLVEVEPLLGGERILFYYTSEQEYVDFRELVRELASQWHTRIEMRHVSARDEAQLVADYEKCGQQCCCKQFLKVLKPVSMRAAKVQKATLDPQKISGRCGRLMCCLRYEDKTYSELKKRLPHRKSYVETEDGIGQVLSTQILTQLVLVKIGMGPAAAYPVENLRVLETQEAKEHARMLREQHEQQQEQARARAARPARPPRGRKHAGAKTKPAQGNQTQRQVKPTADAPGENASRDQAAAADHPNASGQAGDAPRKRKRRRRRRGKSKGDNPSPDNPGTSGSDNSGAPNPGPSEE